MNSRKELIDQTVTDIEKLLQDRFGERGIVDTPKVIGKLLGKSFLDSGSLSQNGIGWAMDHAVAEQLGPCIEGYLALHQALVNSGCTAMSPWDLGYADRYVAAYANDENFKSFAVCTQNYTYMVVITIEKRPSLTEQSTVLENAYSLHIRRCCKNSKSMDGVLVDLTELSFLNGENTTRNHEYFRYGDVRDRGYLCSLVPHLAYPNMWECDRSLVSLSALERISVDLASLVDHVTDEGE